MIDNLVQVADVDARRLSLEKRIAAGPAQLRDVEAKLEQAKAAQHRQSDESKKAGLELKRLEGETKAKQQEIEKVELNRNSAKSNDEFQAHGRKIAQLKDEIGALEMKILEEYERADVRTKDKGPLEKKVKELETQLREQKQKVDAEVAALKKELAAVEAERKAKLTGLDKDQMGVYQRAIDKHKDRAVVAVVDDYCTGCQVKVRPNQSSQLKDRNQLVTCWECARILYVDR